MESEWALVSALVSESGLALEWVWVGAGVGS